ncbi:MAG: glycosyltransferase family protein [Gemmatimonadales bacterium]
MTDRDTRSAGEEHSEPGAAVAAPGTAPTGMGSGQVRRRLLLVSYHFPPSEAVGGLRWQRLTGLGHRRGWDVDVLTLKAERLGRTDWSRVEELPSSTRLHWVDHPATWEQQFERFAERVWMAFKRTGAVVRETGDGPSTSPARPVMVDRQQVNWLSDWRGLVRAHHVWQRYAKEMAWSRAAVDAGLEAFSAAPPDLVLTSGPPHLIHEAGRRLANAFEVPFVMDMRDPWSLQTHLQEHVASPLWLMLAERAESRCVDRANLVIMNTPSAARSMSARWTAKSIMSAMNGWDDETLPDLPWPHQFRIVYAGTVHIDRDPRPLFRAVAELVRQVGASPTDLQVRLLGNVESYGGVALPVIAAQEGIGDYVVVQPPASRASVLEQYAEAAVLVSLPQDTPLSIPSKVFEYMRQPCWILAQATPSSATAELLAGTSAFVLPAENVAATTDCLMRCYREFRAGHRPAPIALEWASRAEEGRRVFDALDALVSRSERS